MPSSTFLPPHRPEAAARKAWAACVMEAEQRAVSYLTAALPDLEVSRVGGPTGPACLAFDRSDCGHVSLIAFPPQATFHGAGLHWELWSAAIGALDDGKHFPLVDAEGSQIEEFSAAAPGSYADESGRDSLVVHEIGTADVSLIDLDTDALARVLGALRHGLGRFRRQQCTRCHVPQWRHAARRSREQAVCESFTLACRDCLPYMDAEQCAQARTGQPCTRRPAREPARRSQGGERVLALLLAEFNGWDLAGLARSAVELFGTYGDVNDELSEAQKDLLERAAVFFDRISEPA